MSSNASAMSCLKTGTLRSHTHHPPPASPTGFILPLPCTASSRAGFRPTMATYSHYTVQTKCLHPSPSNAPGRCIHTHTPRSLPQDLSTSPSLSLNSRTGLGMSQCHPHSSTLPLLRVFSRSSNPDTSFLTASAFGTQRCSTICSSAKTLWSRRSNTTRNGSPSRMRIGPKPPGANLLLPPMKRMSLLPPDELLMTSTT